MELPNRKRIRLEGFDYSTVGAYFITICTKDRKQILSKITVGDDAHIVPQIHLTRIGRICEKYIEQINAAYENIRVDKYVIMPNHIHLLIVLDGADGTMWASSPTKNVESVIRSFKVLVTKQVGNAIWQRSFYDHIIRGERDYREIWEYIDNNVRQWELDEFY